MTFKFSRRHPDAAATKDNVGLTEQELSRVCGGQSGLDLYRIDLLSVVGKYIGETEKNLERLF